MPSWDGLSGTQQLSSSYTVCNTQPDAVAHVHVPPANVPVPPALQYLDEWGYLLVGLAAALPCFLLPLVLPNEVNRGAGSREHLLQTTGVVNRGAGS